MHAPEPGQDTVADRDRDFLAEIMRLLGVGSGRLFGRGSADADCADLQSLAEALLSTRGEASGVALAATLLARWQSLDPTQHKAWFELLEGRFGPDLDAVAAAAAQWQERPSAETAMRLHQAAEPRRQELFHRLNLAPGGTAALVKMREDLFLAMRDNPALGAIDQDFMHLFNSWFNRGFLELRRIDWSSPAVVLEKIIRYEAVHAIHDWDDLRRRLEPPDRRCFAFFHPRMPDEPLVFVEVALTRGIPPEIARVIAEDRTPLADQDADTAVFYSISNTQAGLRGVSFGNFLIKQVVEELLRELPRLKSFATLSPVPGFAIWLAAQKGSDSRVPEALHALLAVPDWHASAERRATIRPLLETAAAIYFLEARTSSGKPIDQVARFHLNNGARLERLNFCGDVSAKGLAQSHGLMVNYLYDRDTIERNHELYANAGEVVAAGAIRKLIGNSGPSAMSWTLPSMLKPGRGTQQKEG